ncbi:LysR substrate-binding domain-containing protein [Rhodobacteraceae bacterium XHP0102]|nr:LysR substrate-binding domain-containing protein [Rhodobacteraceae bacterium XHP0102]
MIKLEMLRVFLAVAEEGALALAAQKLGRTPSALSMALSQLEAQVGAPLFETDRKNRLTPLGRLVLEEARRATNSYTRSVDAIARHARSLAGTVRVMAVPSATITLLPPAILAFSQARPEVRLEIRDSDTASVVSQVALGESDIGIISQSPRAQAALASVSTEVILRDPLGVVARHDGPFARRVMARAPSWRDVAYEPLIANPLCDLVDHPSVAAALQDCRIEARNTTALLAFVRAGIGITILPQTAMAEADPALRFFAPNDPQSRRELCKIRNRAAHLSPVALSFWDLLAPQAPSP